MPAVLSSRLADPCKVKLRDALVMAHNCVYFALPASRSMSHGDRETAARLLLNCKKDLEDPMRLDYCTFCVAALEGECSLENAAVRRAVREIAHCSLLLV